MKASLTPRSHLLLLLTLGVYILSNQGALAKPQLPPGANLKPLNGSYFIDMVLMAELEGWAKATGAYQWKFEEQFIEAAGARAEYEAAFARTKTSEIFYSREYVVPVEITAKVQALWRYCFEAGDTGPFWVDRFSMRGHSMPHVIMTKNFDEIWPFLEFIQRHKLDPNIILNSEAETMLDAAQANILPDSKRIISKWLVTFNDAKLRSELEAEGKVDSKKVMQVKEYESELRAAKSGDAAAMVGLGWKSTFGLGTAVNFTEAREWAEKAGQIGLASKDFRTVERAAYLLDSKLVGAFKQSAELRLENSGLFFLMPEGERDDHPGRSYATESSEKGGKAFFYGSGVETDYQKARILLDRAGVSTSAYELAQIYAEGLGGAVDMAKAAAYYSFAATVPRVQDNHRKAARDWLLSRGLDLETGKGGVK